MDAANSCGSIFYSLSLRNLFLASACQYFHRRNDRYYHSVMRLIIVTRDSSEEEADGDHLAASSEAVIGGWIKDEGFVGHLFPPSSRTLQRRKCPSEDYKVAIVSMFIYLEVQQTSSALWMGVCGWRTQIRGRKNANMNWNDQRKKESSMLCDEIKLKMKRSHWPPLLKH